MASTGELYIGLMSGTSLDAVDAVLVRFAQDSAHSIELIATREHPFPADLRATLLNFIEMPGSVGLDQLGQADRLLGLLYAEAVNALLADAGKDANQVTAIGNHGQTIRHSPDTTPAFTMQIGNAATLANGTGIATVADFRSADIALGGQGAPLVPAFHQWAFGHSGRTGAVINIGGISNITVLKPGSPLLGFDTGPGNTLLDAWYRKHHDRAYDHNGTWASSGKPIQPLLDAMLKDPYFSQPAPKSTGREYFNHNWLDPLLQDYAAAAIADIQATLAELTAVSIAAAVNLHFNGGSIWLCGGGALNSDLVQRISAHLPAMDVKTTAALGVPPAWVEAVAFAWLARARWHGEAAGSPDVTGASKAAVLGGLYLPPQA